MVTVGSFREETATFGLGKQKTDFAAQSFSGILWVKPCTTPFSEKLAEQWSRASFTWTARQHAVHATPTSPSSWPRVGLTVLPSAAPSQLVNGRPILLLTNHAREMCPRASLLATAVRTLLTDTFHDPSATIGRRSTSRFPCLRRGNPFKWSPPPRCTQKSQCLATRVALRTGRSMTCFDGCDSSRANGRL